MRVGLRSFGHAKFKSMSFSLNSLRIDSLNHENEFYIVPRWRAWLHVAGWWLVGWRVKYSALRLENKPVSMQLVCLKVYQITLEGSTFGVVFAGLLWWALPKDSVISKILWKRTTLWKQADKDGLIKKASERRIDNWLWGSMFGSNRHWRPTRWLELVCLLIGRRAFLGAWSAELEKWYQFILLFCCSLNHVPCVVKDCGLPVLETTTTYRDWLIVERKPAGLVSAWFHIFRTCQYSSQRQRSTYWLVVGRISHRPRMLFVISGRRCRPSTSGSSKPWTILDCGIPNFVGSSGFVDRLTPRTAVSWFVLSIGPMHGSRSRLVLVLWLAQM